MKDKTNLRKIILLFIAIIIFASISFFCVEYWLRSIKKSVNFEAGINRIELKYFFNGGKVYNNAKFITDVNEIDQTKVGSYEVIIDKGNGKEVKSTLNIIDTTSPKVIFKDVSKAPGYEVCADDFIESIDDVSITESSVLNSVDTSKIGIYDLDIEVSDMYGNKTKSTQKLNIMSGVESLDVELGTNIVAEDIIYDSSSITEDVNNQINTINVSGIGNYKITYYYDNTEYNINVTKKDTTKPILVLKEVTIYVGSKMPDVSSFIKEMGDNSGVVNAKITTNTDVSKIGTYSITIMASDEVGNVTKENTTLKVVDDGVGPVFSGLNNIQVNKYTDINYTNGVSATDAKDGKMTFTYDASSVDVTKYGTYYVTYTSTDNSGNTTTKKRKVIVNHDDADVEALINKYSEICGKDYVSIRNCVASKISYSHNNGGSDPIWYGLTNFSGDCLVHAKVYKALLEKAGYEVMLIWVTDYSHYWDLVKIDGVWRHSDSTPTTRHNMIVAETDDVRYAHLQGRNWDRSLWPKAE